MLKVRTLVVNSFSIVKALANEQLITQLLDFQPDSVVWFSPVFTGGDANNEVIDFEVQYCNAAAAKTLGTTPAEVIGSRLSDSPLQDEVSRNKIFQQCLQVWKSGHPIEFTYHSTSLDCYLNVQRSKVQGGILSIVRDRTAEIKADLNREEQEKKFQHIFETSEDGILVLESIKNKEAEVIDFRIAHCNKKGFEVGKLPADAIGKTLLEVLPHLKLSGQLQLHKQVLQTGEPVRYETSFRNKEGEEYGWFIVSLTKLKNDVVSRFVDISELKLSQEALKQESQFTNSILNASLNGIYVLEAVTDKQNNIVDFFFITYNQKFQELTGWLGEPLTGKSFLKYFPGTKETGLYNSFCQVIESNGPQRQGMYYAKAFNRWYDYMAVKLGESRVVVTFQEVTQQREAALKIEQQKTLLDNILKYSPSGVAVYKALRNREGGVEDFQCIIANHAAETLTQIPNEERLQKTVSEITPGYKNDALFSLSVAALDTGEPFQTQYYHSGIHKWLDFSVAKMDDNHLINVFTDVTATKETQLQNEQVTEKLRAVVNASQAGVFIGSPVRNERGEIEDFRFTLVNKVLAAFTGQPPQALIGELGSRWFARYKTNGLFEIFKHSFETGSEYQFEFLYQGHRFDAWVNITTAKLGNEIMGSFTDFTPLKKAQIQLEQSVEELKQSNTSLEEFAYVASHDLQEPLRKIHTFSDRLKQDLSESLNSNQQRMFERIENATQRMRQLIDDLLAYSNVSQKQRTFEPVDLKTVVKEVVNDLETSIEEKGAAINITELPVVNGDMRQLRQLFQNLISNALKYSRPDVAPQVTISSQQVNGVECKGFFAYTKPEQLFYLIEVKDNGIGFDQQDAQKIFQVFQRLHGRMEYEGTGIGLAIAQKVVTNHQGHICAEGETGKGATFKVYLPAEQNKTAL